MANYRLSPTVALLLVASFTVLAGQAGGSGDVTAPPADRQGISHSGRLVMVTQIETLKLDETSCEQEQAGLPREACEPRLTAGSVLTVISPRDDEYWDDTDGTESETEPNPDPEPDPEPDPPVVVPPPVRDSRAWPSAPKYKPAGRARSYVLSMGGAGYAAHWDYCKPFTYMVNPDRMTPALRADVVKAIARFGAATGIWFEYAGKTDTLPFRDADADDGNREPSGQTLVIAVSDKRTYPILRGSVAGIGGQAALGYSGPQSISFHEGGIVIDADALGGLRRGFGPGSYGSLLLHELGHVAGLGHVDDATQIMNPVVSRRAPARYGSGDLAGFAALSDMGCFPPAGS